ncbi:MAG TPA: hypothetical protein VF692_10465, partial [Pyrinomonadaceae bacterium]
IIIYIELLDEGTRVFAPVPAIHLGGRYYKVLEHNRADYGVLRFNPGTFVLCLPCKLSVNENLVPLAYCEVSKEEAEYMSLNSVQK